MFPLPSSQRIGVDAICQPSVGNITTCVQGKSFLQLMPSLMQVKYLFKCLLIYFTVFNLFVVKAA